MLPLSVQPSLILSDLLRSVDRTSLESLLTPGEAVRATVLNVQDDGSLLLLLKGVTLRAASLVGSLSVGQVVEAHVELRDGQVLLRLDQPRQISSAIQAGALAADRAAAISLGGLGAAAQGTQAVQSTQIAALLKTLLPTDEPLASGLAKLAASLTAAAERRDLAPQSLARFQALAQQILVAPEQLDGPLAGDRIRGALLALGVQHESTLLADWGRTGTVTGQGAAPNLKALLMTLLAEVAQDGPEALSSSPAAVPPERSVGPTPFTAVPASPLYDVALVRGQAPVPFSNAAGRQEVTGSESFPSDQRAAVRATEGLSSPSQAEAEVLLQAERPVSVLPLLPLQSPTTGPEKSSADPVPVQALPGHAQDPEAQLSATAGQNSQSQPATPQGEAGLRTDSQPQAGKGGPVALPARLPSLAQAGLVGQDDESAKPSGASSLSGNSEPEGSGRGGWIRDAQQVLTLIERTQVLAVLNGQAGQPILFELPFANGGQARIYVEERTAGGRGSQDQARSYNVVTLLELDGLGALRVDTLLTGKRLSARFLLDHPEVRQRVAGYLPALNTSLSAKGYQVDVLAADVGEPQQVRGDDVRARAVPRVSLVSRKA
ncbi:MAG: flagellar hook-length control protein FliK [Nitrospirae bacterium]|nr:MAG: flagellar hook-length control protein FliK [Nitrospirota bacterium]